MVTKGSDGRWYKPCSGCGEIQSYLRKNYAEESLRLNKVCKKCSNRETDNCHRGYYNDIRVSWFHKFRISAETRGIQFSISVEDIWNIYVNQDFRCALTGWPVGWSDVGAIHTASIDRIDSSLGYVLGNIQIVHKDGNMAKQQFTQDYFLELCAAVATNM